MQGAAARSARRACAATGHRTDAALPPCAQACEDADDVEVLAELTVDEVEARKRRRAEADGDVVDLTVLPVGEDEAPAVARANAKRAKRAAADAAAAEKAAAALGRRLIAAAYEGDAGAVSRLLKQGADFAFADSKGATALHFAARYGRVEAIETLLEFGARASLGASALLEDNARVTPVHDAITDLRERRRRHERRRDDGRPSDPPSRDALYALVDSLAGHSAALRGLVEGQTSALCHAVHEGEELAMRYLVLRGCAGLDFAAVREALRPALFEARNSYLKEYLSGWPVHVRDPGGSLFCMLADERLLVSSFEKRLDRLIRFNGCTNGNCTLSYKGKLLNRDRTLGFYQLPAARPSSPDSGAPAHRDGCVHVVSDATAAFFPRRGGRQSCRCGSLREGQCRHQPAERARLFRPDQRPCASGPPGLPRQVMVEHT